MCYKATTRTTDLTSSRLPEPLLDGAALCNGLYVAFRTQNPCECCVFGACVIPTPKKRAYLAEAQPSTSRHVVHKVRKQLIGGSVVIAPLTTPAYCVAAAAAAAAAAAEGSQQDTRIARFFTAGSLKVRQTKKNVRHIDTRPSRRCRTSTHH